MPARINESLREIQKIHESLEHHGFHIKHKGLRSMHAHFTQLNESLINPVGKKVMADIDGFLQWLGEKNGLYIHTVVVESEGRAAGTLLIMSCPSFKQVSKEKAVGLAGNNLKIVVSPTATHLTTNITSASQDIRIVSRQIGGYFLSLNYEEQRNLTGGIITMLKSYSP